MSSASVIVCTRNRSELLEGCLTSIADERPTVEWELIVVDNASTDDTAAVVARCAERSGDLRVEYLVEEQLGLSHARNRGVAAAQGDYLLFTDDDVIVQPGWIDALCAAFAEPDVAAVAGRIAPRWPTPPPRWLSGRHTSILALTDFGDDPRELTADEVPVGANMAIRASVLGRSSAPFDTRLGHRGSTYFAYEEFEVFRQLRAAGRLVYRPDAVVLHRILPERMTWAGMRRATIDNGFGSRRAERLRGTASIPLRVSVPATLRAYAAAYRRSRRNGAGNDVDPDAAFDELRAYWELGRWLEVVFGESRVGRWLLARIV